MNATKKTISIEGMNRGQAMEALIKGGMSFGDAEKYWAEHGAKRGGFRQMFYAELIKHDMDKDAVAKFMEEQDASDNVKNLINYYYGIAKLVADALEHRA